MSRLAEIAAMLSSLSELDVLISTAREAADMRSEHTVRHLHGLIRLKEMIVTEASLFGRGIRIRRDEWEHTVTCLTCGADWVITSYVFEELKPVRDEGYVAYHPPCPVSGCRGHGEISAKNVPYAIEMRDEKLNGGPK